MSEFLGVIRIIIDIFGSLSFTAFILLTSFTIYHSVKRRIKKITTRRRNTKKAVMVVHIHYKARHAAPTAKDKRREEKEHEAEVMDLVSKDGEVVEGAKEILNETA